jgi:hypothetical protein
MEADFGAGRPVRFDTNVPPADLPFFERIGRKLASSGVERGKTETSGGADIEPLKALGVPIIAISQDGTTYFDLHHTPNDTLDKVDPAAPDATIDAYALAAEMIANR